MSAREGLEPDQEQHYTEAEAKSLIGSRWKSKIEFSNVPVGTVGQVVAADREGLGHWDVVVEWEMDYQRPSGQGLRDWFSRDEIERFMQRVTN